jgi:hypothetical protein
MKRKKIYFVFIPLLFFYGIINAQTVFTINLEKDGELYLYNDGGKIDIFTWNKDCIRAYSASGRVRGSKYGNKAEIKIYSSGYDKTPPKTEIYLPENINIDITSVEGDIEIHSKNFGKIKIAASSGNILIGELNTDAELSTGGGDIKIENINGNLKIYETVGNIRVKKIGGSADIKTLGGDINIQSIEKSIEANTKAGSIEIGNVGGDAIVTNQSGNVKIGNVKRDATLNSGGGDIFLKSGNGSISARTTGGDITLKNVYGSVQAKTDGGKIVVELRPGIYDKFQSSTIETEKGDILFYIQANSYAKICASINVNKKQNGTKESLNYYRIKSDFASEGNTFKVAPLVIPRKEYQEFNLFNNLKGNHKVMLINLRTNNSNIEIKKLKK